MMDYDPEKWSIPFFVAIGLIISQLFIYGKKVKQRVRISAAELTGDVMQFGVRMAVTIGSINMLEVVLDREIKDLWQVVLTTILICTSFDTYFLKIREIAIGRFVGAWAVLLGRTPNDSTIRVPAGDGAPEEVQAFVIKNPKSNTSVGLKTAYPTEEIPEDQAELLRKLDKYE